MNVHCSDAKLSLLLWAAHLHIPHSHNSGVFPYPCQRNRRFTQISRWQVMLATLHIRQWMSKIAHLPIMLWLPTDHLVNVKITNYNGKNKNHFFKKRSSCRGEAETNPTRNDEVVDTKRSTQGGDNVKRRRGLKKKLPCPWQWSLMKIPPLCKLCIFSPVSGSFSINVCWLNERIHYLCLSVVILYFCICFLQSTQPPPLSG